ncbi:hypothetical protein SteCoe_17208 [Stentor coeruleus]|uniref:Protein kinase domain-containing protein n=1 Tax=Stentor coeruleus TaxID=5963 RepID=A0A1R2BZI3_9CILI|nr:hypothetical protein SteCoe_17208 [Stentor coeruleus]
MECTLLECNKPADDFITCGVCFIPKYCSEQCRELDFAFHSESCRPHLYTLKDFTVAKNTKILGTGAYGKVQLVQKIDSKKLYAMKIYKKACVSEIIPLKNLFREISLHKSLNHPNIIHLQDHLEDRLRVYIVLEYAEKGSLFDLLRQKIKLPEKDIWPLFTQICTGLNYLHSKNLLHRDLKPENLLINKDDIIKICDFGWSARGNEARVTFCGTLDYMSPEMLERKPQSYKVDIWALGILLYEMLHGTPPFRAKNPKEMVRMTAEGRYNVGLHVSYSAKQLISLLLQPDPEDRPPIIEVLKTQWVQDYCLQKLKLGWKIKHPDYGDGIIKDSIGLVYTIIFENNEQEFEFIENDLIMLYTVFDQNGHVMFDHSPSPYIKPRSEPIQNNTKISPRYKDLDIDVNLNKKPTVKSATGSRIGSENNSPVFMGDSNFTFDGHHKDPRLPRSPKAIEEVKRSQKLPSRKNVREDYEGINLSPEPIPTFLEKSSGTPKSSFLQKFKKGGLH